MSVTRKILFVSVVDSGGSCSSNFCVRMLGVTVVPWAAAWSMMIRTM